LFQLGLHCSQVIGICLITFNTNITHLRDVLGRMWVHHAYRGNGFVLHDWEAGRKGGRALCLKRMMP
jgi:hypothetical protein